MKIYLKNMLSSRCKMALKKELKKLGISYRTIDLGVVETNYDVSVGKLELLSSDLLQIGLEVIHDKKEIISEKVANAIIRLVHYSDEPVKNSLSDYLCEKLNYDYGYLAAVFSEVKGISIEKFYMVHKIERVKELLRSSELSLQEISMLTNYSSSSHLSSQFKRKTGISPTDYRQLGINNPTLVNYDDVQLPVMHNNEFIQREAGSFPERRDMFLIYG
jgi:AraC-like DNA-binding protein